LWLLEVEVVGGLVAQAERAQVVVREVLGPVLVLLLLQELTIPLQLEQVLLGNLETLACRVATPYLVRSLLLVVVLAG
jgi:hypothetical protein